LQNPSETNGDNLKNVRRETERTFRKKGGIFQRKNSSFKSTVRTKIRGLYRGISVLKKG
jgi:hypothetical protein